MILNLGNLPRTIWVEMSGGAPVAGFVDQRRLPGELILVRTADWREMVDAVKTLAVRGAPAIGVAGAAAVMLAAFEYSEGTEDVGYAEDAEGMEDAGEDGGFDRRLEEAASVIAEARPTAVNLPGACAGPWRRLAKSALLARRLQRQPRRSTNSPRLLSPRTKR